MDPKLNFMNNVNQRYFYWGGGGRWFVWYMYLKKSIWSIVHFPFICSKQFIFHLKYSPELQSFSIQKQDIETEFYILLTYTEQ